jgi:hypothetical protein
MRAANLGLKLALELCAVAVAGLAATGREVAAVVLAALVAANTALLVAFGQ